MVETINGTQTIPMKAIISLFEVCVEESLSWGTQEVIIIEPVFLTEIACFFKWGLFHGKLQATMPPAPLLTAPPHRASEHISGAKMQSPHLALGDHFTSPSGKCPT